MSDTEPPPAPEEPPSVEIHKPKPVHNWHEFLKEYAIIVLGVCTALAGEQMLEWFHWRGEVQAARTVIATEMSNNVVGAIRRMRTVQCMEDRLDTLSKILDDASRSGSLPAVGYVGQPPRHRWLSGAWDSVVASQTATHFPPQQLADLNDVYKLVERAQDNGTQEAVAWSELYTMVGPGRRLDPVSEAQLRAALSRARMHNRTLATVSMFLVTGARRMALPYTQGELDHIAQARTDSLTGDKPSTTNLAAASEICGPIGPVPPGYGEGPTKMSPAVVSAFMKALPGFGPAP